MRPIPASKFLRTVQSCCNPQLRCIRTQSTTLPKKHSKFSWGPLIAVAGATGASGFAYSMHKDRKREELKRAEKEQADAANAIAKQIKDSLESSGERKQVEKSWEKPGVFLWGSNEGGVVDPKSTSSNVKLPRRLEYFDGKIVRDLKVNQQVGAAILDNGDLVQWGKAYSQDSKEPEKTVTGKDLISISLSRDRVLAIGSDGTVYSIPTSKEAQLSGAKLTENSWTIPKQSKARLSYRVLKPKLESREKIESISTGEEHALLLTNRGRLFSAACASDHYPSRGQLGVPGLTWETRPEGPFDTCHEVKSLRNIKQIAAGEFHNVVLDKVGQVYTFGDNSSGQLGVERSGIQYTAEPLRMPLNTLHGKVFNTKAIAIATGGSTSFFVTEARKFLTGVEEDNQSLANTSIDVWSCGNGVNGNLGNGKFVHTQGSPTKVKSISGLFEYNESLNQIVPIGIQWLEAGATHAAAVLGPRFPDDNNDTSFGLDLLLWGENSSYQLGTGKKSSLAKPTYIAPPGGAGAGDPLSDGNRFQVTPPRTAKIDGHKLTFEQRVACGKGVTGVFCAVPK
ncbi:hypothetical protein KEM54_001448 [Ascosphaera aggregata]|nr:hypothetical protein KEM54_001448 [Ascosphaera aggregata]